MIIAYAIILTLFIANSLIFIKDFKDSRIQHQKIVTDNLEAIKKNSGNLWNLTFTDQKLAYPPSVLGFMSEAWEKNLPNGIKLNFFTTSNPEYYKKEDSFFSESEALDWNNILILFVSFICIFFSYDAFSGEKVEGTLKLMMSNSVSRTHIILGKYLGICFVTLLPLLAGAIMSSIILLLSPVIQLSWNHFFDIIYYLFAASLFISLNVCIGMLLSTLTSRPIVSLSFVILVWIVFSIVIPGIGWVIAKKTVPIESLNSINDKLSIETKALGGSFWNGHWKTPTPEVLANKNYFDKVDEIVNKTWNDYRNSLFNQVNSGIAFSKISPFQVFRFLGDKVADNGFPRYNNFYNQLKNYHQTYRDFIILKDKGDQQSHHLIWANEYCTSGFMSKKSVSYEEVPKFEYKIPFFVQTINATKWELLILLLWNMILFTGVSFAFIRYDVR
jgi:ABC-type transport system involved in multi-copper enzyme maturation permease subunit